ncbi:MAG: chemotaxis protein CheA [Pseudomonadales bacterium]|nr:chemotaxis protein CheA [Pseudomonadales bacterium]
MSISEDDEILQDFLVEAGEILEQLNEQLVDLEQKPDDVELLNAIFRGFHTVKGGAGFLQIENLVNVCHVTENLFDSLRKGELAVSAELMDIVLQVLDVVNEMFAQVRAREEVCAADDSLLAAISGALEGGGAEPEPDNVEVASEPVAEEPSTDGIELFDSNEESESDGVELFGEEDFVETAPTDSNTAAAVDVAGSHSDDEISEDEFDRLLDQLHGKGKHGTGSIAQQSAEEKPRPVTTESAGDSSDEISEDEFEKMLDDLHGKGKHSSTSALKETEQSVSAATALHTASAPEKATSAQSSDSVIDDSEFDKLLDDLHGKGKGPTKQASAAEKSAKPDVPKKPDTPAPTKADKPAVKPVKASAATKKEPPPPAAETTVRVDTQRLDDIMNMVGELVLVRNRLVRLSVSMPGEDLAKAVSNLDVVTADLQSSVMKTRMQPIKKVFGRFPRVVRDLARSLKKEVTLQMAGEDTDLDKNLVEALADPLVHLVRNSVDHGIESPDEREATGKDRMGIVILSAEQEGDHIMLTISDDGKGMDPDVLRGLAVKKGLMDSDAADRLTDEECFNLIFAPGFSSKEEISDVSGRGVGMDVVKTKIAQLNGAIQIHSELGKGTRIEIKVPLTLAIMPTLMIMLDKQAFALPLVSVNEIFNLDLSKTNIVDGQEVVTVRDKALPLFYLKSWLLPSQDSDEMNHSDCHVVIVTVGTQRVGFVVDQLLGQEEVVIKPLGSMLQGTAGMAGATITGDGRIALILDVPSMLKRYAA